MSANADDKSLFYERFADQFDDEMNRYEVEKRLRLVFDNALADLDLSGRTLLDAGCGTGLFSARAAGRGASVTSLDVGDRLLARVAEKCESTRVVGRLEALPFADASFDVVVSTEVVEHLPQPVDGMRELVRVLRPGGRLVVTTPNRVWHPAVRVANALHLRPYEGLEHWIGYAQLRDWTEALGIRVIEHRGFNGLPTLHPRSHALNDRLDGLGGSIAGRFMVNQLLVGERALA
jgi:2-polyprenyl-3-methyl-5-hydroxy-6-metoxy-1,4-benzoquinol methylase